MVEEIYGDDRVFWFDEHFIGEFSIPETEARAAWYEVTGWPYVRVDGSRLHMGIDSCEETAQLLGNLIDARLDETGGMSPVSITGNFRADGAQLEWDVTFRLLDPVDLVDLRGTFVAIEDETQGYLGELFPRVTRVIQYESVVLTSPGDSARFVFTMPQDPQWNEENMRAIVFLQQTSDNMQIIQGAVLPNELVLAAAEPVADRAARSRIERVVPNPFTVSTEVIFSLSERASRGALLLEIIDPLGRRVRELPVAAGLRAGGQGAVTWDGRSEAGEQLPMGSYFFRLTTVEGVSRGKVILMR